MNTPIPPDTALSVTLEAQQWNTVMAALSEAPYRVAAPLIQAITGQLQNQVQAGVSNGTISPDMAHAANGLGRIPEIPPDR